MPVESFLLRGHCGCEVRKPNDCFAELPHGAAPVPCWASIAARTSPPRTPFAAHDPCARHCTGARNMVEGFESGSHETSPRVYPILGSPSSSWWVSAPTTLATPGASPGWLAWDQDAGVTLMISILRVAQATARIPHPNPRGACRRGRREIAPSCSDPAQRPEKVKLSKSVRSPFGDLSLQPRRQVARLMPAAKDPASNVQIGLPRVDFADQGALDSIGALSVKHPGKPWTPVNGEASGYWRQAPVHVLSR